MATPTTKIRGGIGMKATVDTKEFKRIIKALKPFTRPDGTKMEYIFLEVNNETQEVKFEALDGHRIAVEYLKCTADTSFTTYIKPFTLMKTKEKFTDIEIINNKAYITMGDYSVGFKQPEGIWYETKQMLEKYEKEEPVLKVGINAKLLIDALKNISQKYGNDWAIIECRTKEDPIIIKSINDERNIRLVLPMKYSQANEIPE